VAPIKFTIDYFLFEADMRHSSVSGKNYSRREFLKKTMAIAGGAAAFPYVVPSSAPGQAAPSGRITLGFIGMGKQSQHLIRSFLNSPGTQTLAVCDVDKLKLKRAQDTVQEHYSKPNSTPYKGCAAYGDFRELLARDDIDAVVIATPDHWHSITVIQAAQAGKDIYCEKPLAQTIAEARAMVNAVRRYVRIFQTGSMQRSDDKFRFACELVRNGYIGEVKTVTVGIGGPPEDKPLPAEPVPDYLDWDMWVGPAPWRPYNSDLSPHISFDGFPNWRYHSDFGGGGMTDWGAHHFDIAQWGLGMDETGPVAIIPPDDKDYKVLTYKYANSVIMTRDNANGILFTGTKGRVEVNRGYLKTWPETLQSQQIKPEEIHLYDSKNHYTDWLDAIRKRTKPICDIETGCRSVTVCHLGNIAYRLGRPLKWDPQREVFVNDSNANRLLSRAMRSPWHL
jgi:predicted dehydrogenase